LDAKSALSVVGILLAAQFGAMILAHIFTVLDRLAGLRWLVAIGSRPRVRWSLSLFFVSWLFMIFLQSGFYYGTKWLPVFQGAGLDNIRAMLSVSVANLAFIGVAILVVGPGWKSGLARLGLSGPDYQKQVWIGIRAALLISPWVYLVNIVANQVFQANPHAVLKMLDQELNLVTAILAAISAIILAPLAEEILFRGMMLGALIRKSKSRPAVNRKFPVQMANVATSLFFALLHADAWPAPLGIFVLSLGLGKLYISTGRLWPCIVAHAVFNSTGILGMLFLTLAKQVGLVIE
jgi:membrane protease YdiL (CAAX protease family)